MQLKKPIAVCMNDLPQNSDVNDFEELNKVLKFLGIPTTLDPNDPAMINKIEEICSEKFLNFPNDRIQKIKKTFETQEANLKIEKECDLLEITLANLKDKYSEYKKLYSLNLEELETELSTLNSNFNNVQFETINLDILSKVYDFIKGEEVDGDLINSLSYVSKMTGFKNLVEKYEIMSEIEENDTSRVFSMLIKSEVLRLEDICKSMGGDRINTLELLYYLQSIDVITFDNVNGAIRLKK